MYRLGSSFRKTSRRMLMKRVIVWLAMKKESAFLSAYVRRAVQPINSVDGYANEVTYGR